MTDDALVSHIEQLESQTTDGESSSVAAEQAKAMDYYLNRPFGTEEEGRSAVVSSDVWDVVEGMTPLVLKPFVSSDDVVRFNPEGPEDEQAAEQESDYINWVVTQRNDVFETLVNWVKTGLLQKNGVVKYWWDSSKRKRIERYYGLSEDVLMALLSDDSVSVIEHTENPQQATDEMGQPVEAPSLHDVVLRVVEEFGRPTYAVIPPEELRISRTATSHDPRKARFVEHVTRKTISELREMGYDVPDEIGDEGSSDPRLSEQYLARMATDGVPMDEAGGADPSMREVLFREAYLYVDADGDGEAELRKVCLVGRTVLSNEETEEIPFVGWTPYPQPFKFDGRCPADETLEIQLIKSTVLRQTMDNIYTINNNTRYVSSKVNLDDLLDNQIAGIVRVDGDVVSNHVMPASVTPIGNVTMPMIEYFDSAKENRTGFTRYNQGTDADSLNKTATGVRLITEAGNERIGLISRCFAEQGLKNLMIGIHGLCRRHANRPEKFKLRGEWIEVDPRSWVNRYDMTVSVGLGSSDKQLQMQAAQMLLQTQLQLLPVPGLVQPKNLYESGAKLAQALGEKNAEKYFSSPDENPPQPPNPMDNPEFKLKIAELQLKDREVAIKERDSGVREEIAQTNAAAQHGKLALEAERQGHDMQLQLIQAMQAMQSQMQSMEQSQAELMMRLQQQSHSQAMDMAPEEPLGQA